ncbi:MAG: hypothetical protein HUJ59_02930 [Bacilli bacterium]|nr:hypothetical protein [Bacilli bacterium]
MKKLSKTFLKVQKIISIIMIPLFALVALSGAICAGVGAAMVAGGEEEAGNALIVAASGCHAFWFWLVAAIASTVLVSIGSKKIAAAKTKAEAKSGAILAIVSIVALGLPFGAIAGIFCLAMKEEDFQADLQHECGCGCCHCDEKVEAPKEEVVDAVVEAKAEAPEEAAEEKVDETK